MQVINSQEWAKIPKDYKSVMSGQKFRLGIVEGGATGLIPINVMKQSAIDAIVEAAFYKVASGVQINVMNLGKISKAGEVALRAGADVEAAVAAAVQQYREN